MNEREKELVGFHLGEDDSSAITRQKNSAMSVCFIITKYLCLPIAIGGCVLDMGTSPS